MADREDDREPKPWLVCRTGPCLLALPIGQVGEAMRPLPVERLAGAPEFVRGLSIIRGAPMPVVDVGTLVNGVDHAPGRLVTVRTGDRMVALLVGSVVGVRQFAAASQDQPPPLLSRAAAEIVTALATLDDALLLFLGTARLLPEDFLAGRTATPEPA